jgi:phosphate starvation-inducible PhoH-like protein
MNDILSVTLESLPNEAIREICGHHQSHLKIIEEELGVRLTLVGNKIAIQGDSEPSEKARRVLDLLAKKKLEPNANDNVIDQKTIYQQVRNMSLDQKEQDHQATVIIKTPLKQIRGKTRNQNDYLTEVVKNDVIFGVGPAGTGKTYLAVACAVQALLNEEVDRILLVRPGVEAGENLGFLPGDIGQKIDPYLRPLYDALYDFLGAEKVERMLESKVVELAPLAYMRGRTLSNAFVILDEAQNATENQMKMFLTRIGYGTKAVVTGDISQVDLPRGTQSGLRQATAILNDIKGVAVCQLTGKDIVRHPLVQRIIERYDVEES